MTSAMVTKSQKKHAVSPFSKNNDTEIETIVAAQVDERPGKQDLGNHKAAFAKTKANCSLHWG